LFLCVGHLLSLVDNTQLHVGNWDAYKWVKCGSTYHAGNTTPVVDVVGWLIFIPTLAIFV
jgi:hypothetical protein